ncbi:Uncharacterised protein [Salmonella enterica subsp. enterica serovar Bovismorbificans]|uniref:Uncharacterized protein n=1 Tax=Salmonella enterica subsp. enterica serovar Bovismorbificans TaxID=58097 RepID=A0A655DZD0_SALET|nr:Uncharacterised protein [Salmonella enterica subsp. enterica serovar Bovismorbificans]
MKVNKKRLAEFFNVDPRTPALLNAGKVRECHWRPEAGRVWKLFLILQR